MRRLLLVLLIALSTAGTASASGSFSAVIDPLALTVDLNIEQSVGEHEGWTLYAGSGFAASPDGVQKLQPYGLACRGYNLILAGAEVCAELRAPIIGDGPITRIFLSLAW